jgi:hypothetical protein
LQCGRGNSHERVLKNRRWQMHPPSIILNIAVPIPAYFGLSA